MKEHVIALLSEFVDGRLPEADRRMVETHVEKCETCASELKDLKGLTKLLASTPPKPLPVGFLQRLENRRKHEAAVEAEAPKGFLPMPAKALAFGLSAIAVCFVGWDALNGPGRLEDRIRQTAPLSKMAPGEKFTDHRARLADSSVEGAAASGFVGGGAGGGGGASLEDSDALKRADTGSSSNKKEVHAAGRPLEFDEPAPAPKASAMAAPMREQPTNEQLQRKLDEERRKLGIQEIMPPGSISKRFRAEPEGPPMSQEEARVYMRQMSENLQRQRMGMENYSEPVELGGGAAPKLLKKDAADGAPIGQDKSSLKGFGVAGALRGGSGPLEAAAGVAQAPVTVVPYAERKARSKAAPRPNASADAKPAPAPAAPAAAAPAAEPTAHAARSAEELDALWKRLGNPGERPAVDFSKEMVVAVTAGGPVEIVNVWATGRRLVVEYRLLPDGDGTSAFRVVTKSDLPPSLQSVK